MGSTVRMWLVVLLASAACGSQGRAGFLTTTFANNNGHNGNMFDVVTLG